MHRYRYLAAILLLVLAVMAGRLLYERGQGADQVGSPDSISVRDRRPQFVLEDLDGTPRRVDEWDGKVLLLNFWATWCPPCRFEIPELIALQQAYGDRSFQIIGIAIDDRQAARDYAEAVHINYPILTGEQDASLVARDYGNAIGALPYTVVIDREGRINYTRQGQLDPGEAEAVIKTLLSPVID